MSKKVYVTRMIPEVGVEKLKEQGYEVDVNPDDRVLSKEELLSALGAKPYDAVLCLLTDKIDDDVFKATPQAKIFANYAVGYNNIDTEAAKANNVLISNTPGVLTETVAEYTFALLLSIAHRIPEADRFTKAGKYEGWGPRLLLGTGAEKKTLGIVGLGRIGSQFSRYCRQGLEMNIIYYDINRNEEFEKETGAQFREEVVDVMKEADFVSVHVPLLDSTTHLINKEMLEAMKPTAYLINTSRGPVVDEKALVKALQDGALKGAALDVFEEEPKFESELAEMDNVILTPHIASGTEETRSKMSEMAADNIIAVLEGQTPPNLVE